MNCIECNDRHLHKLLTRDNILIKDKYRKCLRCDLPIIKLNTRYLICRPCFKIESAQLRDICYLKCPDCGEKKAKIGHKTCFSCSKAIL